MKKIYKNKKKRIIYVIIVIFLAFFASYYITYNRAVKNPLKIRDESILIEVHPGQGFYDILNELDGQNVIRNEFMIKVNLSINNRDIKLNPGIYEIPGDIDLYKLIETLEGKTDKNLIKLTIPEGYTIEDIAEAVEENGIASKEEFIESVKNYKDIPDFIFEQENTRYYLEGYLYPDTYYIDKNITKCDDIILMMLNRFKEVLNEVKNDNNISVDDKEINDIITKASIIEKEAKNAEDRPLISSVIDNRLKTNMKLQIDATVIYAINKKVDVVLYKHLKENSPYNTYMYKGLPPGPICSPGRDSIKAAFMPENTNYIYYILKKDSSSHYFTDNYDDFLAKKKEFGY